MSRGAWLLPLAVACVNASERRRADQLADLETMITALPRCQVADSVPSVADVSAVPGTRVRARGFVHRGDGATTLAGCEPDDNCCNTSTIGWKLGSQRDADGGVQLQVRGHAFTSGDCANAALWQRVGGSEVVVDGTLVPEPAIEAASVCWLAPGGEPRRSPSP